MCRSIHGYFSGLNLEIHCEPPSCLSLGLGLHWDPTSGLGFSLYNKPPCSLGLSLSFRGNPSGLGLCGNPPISQIFCLDGEIIHGRVVPKSNAICIGIRHKKPYPTCQVAIQHSHNLISVKIYHESLKCNCLDIRGDPTLNPREFD
jgi:hypothetical protein